MISFLTKGERLGIILSGQSFLEKHRDKFPDTYMEFKSLMKGRLGNYQAKHDWDSKYNEYDDLEDVCGATITMIKNFNTKKSSEAEF